MSLAWLTEAYLNRPNETAAINLNYSTLPSFPVQDENFNHHGSKLDTYPCYGHMLEKMHNSYLDHAV